MTINFRSIVATLAATYLVALATATVTYTQTPAQAPARFDMPAVRADFFAGLTGDMARFDRAMTQCETVLGRLIRWADGQIEFMAQPIEDGTPPFRFDVTFLLLETMRKMDESTGP